MDPFTHALSGAVLARAAAPTARVGRWVGQHRLPSPRGWLVAATLAALFPDVDFVLAFRDPLLYLHHHRGLTHSLVMWPAWALLLGALFARFTGAPAQWPGYALAAGLGIGVHILGDLITPYGTMILAPLSRTSFDFGTTFIIDPWLTAILIAGLVGVWRWQSRAAATAALVVCTIYVGLQAASMVEARALAVAHAEARGLSPDAASVYPQPLSPRNWKLVVAREDGYETALVNLGRRVPPADPPQGHLVAQLRAAYRPANALQWQFHPGLAAGEGATEFVEQAWRHPALAEYREFARHPVVYRVQREEEGACVWFRDLRFDLPGRVPPFRYGMCRDERADRWARSQLGVW